MGHDIYAVTQTGKEIVYLRRNMWSKTIHSLYIALGCEKYDAGCSGNNSGKVVSLKQLESAYEWVLIDLDEDLEDYNDYSDFLRGCIDYCKLKNKKGVKIIFS